MFDILGGFVVKVLPVESRDRLDAVLREMTFDRVDLNGSQIDSKLALHAALYREMNLAAFGPALSDRPNWDSLADLLWQWAMGEAGHAVIKLAFVVANGSAFLSRDSQLVFQFAETCIQLQTNVRQARERDGGTPIMVRVFLVG